MTVAADQAIVDGFDAQIAALEADQTTARDAFRDAVLADPMIVAFVAMIAAEGAVIGAANVAAGASNRLREAHVNARTIAGRTLAETGFTERLREVVAAAASEALAGEVVYG
jgi:hypothetical protein